MLNSVYVLYHTRVDAFGCENNKCLGVFSDLNEVEKAKQYALKQKGFDLKIIPTVFRLWSMKSISRNGWKALAIKPIYFQAA